MTLQSGVLPLRVSALLMLNHFLLCVFARYRAIAKAGSNITRWGLRFRLSIASMLLLCNDRPAPCTIALALVGRKGRKRAGAVACTNDTSKYKYNLRLEKNEALFLPWPAGGSLERLIRRVETTTLVNLGPRERGQGRSVCWLWRGEKKDELVEAAGDAPEVPARYSDGPRGDGVGDGVAPARAAL